MELKILMEVYINIEGNDDITEEVEENLLEEIKDRINNGCTIIGSIGIGFEKEIGFTSTESGIQIIGE